MTRQRAISGRPAGCARWSTAARGWPVRGANLRVDAAGGDRGATARRRRWTMPSPSLRAIRRTSTVGQTRKASASRAARPILGMSLVPVKTKNRGTHSGQNFALNLYSDSIRIGAGPVLRAWRGILLFMSRWFQIESLYKFNAKFCPEWVPRFFVFTGTRDIPRIGLAALEAEAFLVWPTVEVRRIARRLGLGMVQRRLRAVARRSRAAA